MSTIENAVALLRHSVSQETARDHLKDTVDGVAWCLVLLKSSRPSFQAIEKLRSVLREPFQPLYDAYQGQALQLASAVLANILGEKLSDAYIRGDPGLYAEWDKTAYVLLSGVLDALEKPANDHFKVDVGKFLYPTICGFFFWERSQSAPCPSVELCVTAYSILSEAAHGQKSNQVLLRDRAYLGPARLGIMISTSRDYFIMESLQTLLARLLSTEHVADGESMRTQFVQETLGSSELFKCSKELVRVLREASTSDWDTIAAQLLSALAKSDITYPQPFSVKEINACGHVFPQPGASDRLILDRQGFLANVILPMDDVCDSLVVPYGQIQTVNIVTPAATVNEVVVMASLSDPPRVGNTALKVDDGGFYLAFSLGREDLSRFMETLRRRGIGKLTFINSAPRPMKPRKSISLASEVKFASDSSLPAPASDFQEKVKHVKEVYKTAFDDPSSEPVAVSSTPSNSTCNQPQGTANSSCCIAMKLFATGDVGEPDELKQGKGNPIPKSSSTVCSDGGNQVPQEDSYSSMTSKSRCSKEDYQSDEENCKAPVLSSPIIGVTGLTRPLKRVLSSEDDITAISMSCDVKKSAATKLGDDDTSEAQLTTIQLNGQLPEMIAQPGADTDSEAFEVGGYAVGLEVNTDIKVYPASTSTIASHSPIVRGQSADNGQDVAAGAIEGLQPRYLEDTKQLLTPRRNRSSKRQMSSTWIATRPNKRKIQEMTQYGSATDASEVDEEHGSHRKSRKQVHHVPPSNRHTTGSPSISPALVNTTELDAMNTNHVDGVSNTSSTTSPLVLFDETTHEFEKPHGHSVDAGLKQDLIPASRGALVEKAKSRPTPKLVSSPKRSNCVVREEITRVATINSTPSTVATMGVTATAENDLATAPYAQSLRGQPSSAKLMILDERIAVHVTNLNDTETNKRWKHGYDKLEALRSEHSTVLDGLSPETGGKLNGSILVPDLTPRLSDPKRPHVEELPAETALARETGLSMDSFVDSAADDISGLKLTATCLTQPKSDEDVNKNKNLGSLRSKGPESVQSCVTKTIEPPTFTTPLSRKRHSVTFASPIESLMHPNVHARAATKPDGGFQSQVKPFRQRQPWRQEGRERMDGRISRGEQLKNSYTSKDDSFLLMPVPKTTVWSTESVSNVFAAPEPMTDVVDIQDIVEVLDDIHAVITKSITKRFENVRKDVRTCREELLQEVLQDLEIAAATNANQYNDLVQLEEEYYEYHSSMTRRWEELIQCNADLLSHFKDAIRNHDCSISAKTCPASILPRKPLFSDFKDRMML